MAEVMNRMGTERNHWFKTFMQLLAILGIVGILSVIAHKGFVDIAALAGKHSGDEFWRALARYLMRNLAGG